MTSLLTQVCNYGNLVYVIEDFAFRVKYYKDSVFHYIREYKFMVHIVFVKQNKSLIFLLIKGRSRKYFKQQSGV